MEPFPLPSRRFTMMNMGDSDSKDMLRNLARAAELRGKEEGRPSSKKVEDDFQKLLDVKVAALSSELADAHEASLVAMQKQILQLEGSLMLQAALKDKPEPPARSQGLEKSRIGTEKESDKLSPAPPAPQPSPRCMTADLPGSVEDSRPASKLNSRSASKETASGEALTEPGKEEAVNEEMPMSHKRSSLDSLSSAEEMATHTGRESFFEGATVTCEQLKADKIVFELLPTWSEAAGGKSKIDAARHQMLLHKQKKQATLDTFEIMDAADEDFVGVIKTCSLEKLMIAPTGTLRCTWDILGFVLMLFDFVVIPLQMMTSEEGGFLGAMVWLTRIFWSFDLVLNFITGYQHKDRVVMKFRIAALHYLRTWFTLDLSVCLLDWLDVIMMAQDMSAARLGKTIKGFRLLKMARLLRMLKFSRIPDFATPLTYYFRSDFFGSLLGIAKIMFSVIFICHIMACLWYRLGKENEGNDNWLDQHNYVGLDVGHAYLISFHWALTQFCGTMEVRPWNPGERVFTITALFLNFFTAAWVISSITSSMTKLELLTVQRSADEQMLKQYLFDNGVSRKLAVRLQRSAQHALKENERNMPESSVELLRLVSEPLRMELHLERHMPHLRSHNLFGHLAEYHEDAARAVCHTCIKRQAVISGEVIFSPGDMTCGMYFLVNGAATYVTDDGFLEMCPGQWICEPFLWTSWTHRGMLFAAKDCTLLFLDAVAFGKVLGEDQHSECWQLLQVYAKKFLEHMNGQDPDDVSDAHDEMFDVEEALKAADEEGPTSPASLKWQSSHNFRKGQRRKKK